MRLIDDLAAAERGQQNGRKIYSLWDAYPHANLVTYPSIYEGFGNALLETIYFKRLTGNAQVISQWAAGLTIPGDTTTYFNFIASHDGIGLMPARGILTEAEIQALSDKTVAHGGLVSHKTNPDGSRSVYELNITLFDALNNPAGHHPQSLKIDRFMVSQAIMLALAGMPGIYAHSLFGSRNNLGGVQQTGRARTINRQKWHRTDLEAVLADPDSSESLIFNRYRHLLQIRATHPAFHPNGGQTVITGNPAIFALLRIAPHSTEAVLCLHNVSAEPQIFTVNAAHIGPVTAMRELITGKSTTAAAIHLAPYQVKWLALSLQK